jgi:hypothetical protein
MLHPRQGPDLGCCSGLGENKRAGPGCLRQLLLSVLDTELPGKMQRYPGSSLSLSRDEQCRFSTWDPLERATLWFAVGESMSLLQTRHIDRVWSCQPQPFQLQDNAIESEVDPQGTP